MAKTAEERRANWLARMQGEAVSPAAKRSIDNVLGSPSAAVNQFVSTTESLVAMNDLVRAVLDAAGAPVIQYPFYLSFGAELWSLVHKGYTMATGGTSVGSVEAGILRQKWINRGLTEQVLLAIQATISAGIVPNPAPTPELPANHTGISEAAELEVTAVPNATVYHFRVYLINGDEEILVVQKDDVATPTWTVTPALDQGHIYHWDCRAKVGGVWGPFFSPRWDFYQGEYT